MASFEWDPAKAETNKAKHGISFDEASALFAADVDYLELYDEEHSDEEDRFIAIGPISVGIIIVVYTERQDEVVRIVSARKATKKETELFYEHQGGNRDE